MYLYTVLQASYILLGVYTDRDRRKYIDIIFVVIYRAARS